MTLNYPKNNILAVGAHPDDIEIGATMTLRKHIEKGDDVYFVVCSDGEKGGNQNQRIKELEASASLLGVKEVYRLKQPDSFIEFSKIKDPLEEVFYKLNPSIVFFHSPVDNHQDHEVVSKACRVAFRESSNILMYRSPRCTANFAPHLFSRGNLEDVLFKQEVMKKYDSQIQTGSIDLERIKADAYFFGSLGFPYEKGVYCEPFLINHMTYEP